jgi:thiamine pyrophosphate-dependent acetolactate synthase large subunit-like protein
MNHIEMILDYMERHPFTVTFAFIGLGLGYAIDALYNKKEEPVVLFLGDNKEV